MRVVYPRGGSETRWVARDEPGGRAHLARPARSAARQSGRVEAPAVDDHERVPRVRVDGDAAPGAGLAPTHEAGRVLRGGEQPAGPVRAGDPTEAGGTALRTAA